MGCDIHMYVEIYDGSKWEKLGKIFKNDYFDPNRLTQTDSDGYVLNAKITDKPYQGRNYDLFALLANVRNDGAIEPIDLPRGLPEDVSDEILQLSHDWGSDGHSHSWFILYELLEYVDENTDKAMSYSPDFFDRTLTTLKRFGNSKNIRIVFWFDN